MGRPGKKMEKLGETQGFLKPSGKKLGGNCFPPAPNFFGYFPRLPIFSPDTGTSCVQTQEVKFCNYYTQALWLCATCS